MMLAPMETKARRSAIGQDDDRHAHETIALDSAATAAALVSSANSLARALGVVTEQARAVVGARVAVGSVTGPNGDVVTAAAGPATAAVLDAKILARLAARLDRPIRLAGPQIERSAAWRDVRAIVGKQLRSRGWLAAPLVGRDGATIGLLQLFGHPRGVFTAADEAQLGHFALLTSLAAENFRATAEAEQRQRESEDLARAARTLTESLDMDVVAERTVEMVMSLFHLSCATLRIVDPDGSLVVLASSGPERDNYPKGHVLGRGVGVAGRAVLEQRAIWSPDINADGGISLSADLRVRNAAAGVGSTLAVPLLAQGRAIAVLSLADPPSRIFTEREVELAQAFASQAALALDNARLYAEAKETRDLAERRRRLAQTLAELGRLVTRSLNVTEVARSIVESARTLLDTRVCAVYRQDAGTGDLHPIAFSSASGYRGLTDFVIPPETGATGLAVQTREPISAADALEDPRLRLTPALRTHLENSPTRAVIAVPLLVKERVIGAITLVDSVGRRFTSDEVTLAEAFADFGAVALENSRLYEDAERRRTEAEVMAGLAASIGSSLDLDTVLGRVAQAARDLCRCDQAVLAMRDAESGEMTFNHSVGSTGAQPKSLRVEPGKGLGGRVLQTGQAARTDDYAADPELTKDYLDAVSPMGIVAEIVVPVRAGSRIEGLLYAANRSKRPFTDHDEAILVRLADHAAIALTNARLFGAEQSARNAAQQSARHVRDLVQGVDAVVWEADAISGRFSFVSDRAETLLGYPVARWIDEPDFWLEHLHADDRADALRVRTEAIAAGTNYVSTYRMASADGSVIWLRDQVQVLTGSGGRAVQLRGVMVDVTPAMTGRIALEARTRQQVAVAELGQRALAGIDVATLMNEAAAGVATALGVEYAAIFELLPGGDSLRLTAGTGLREGVIGSMTTPVGTGSPAGYALCAGTAIVSEDIRTDRRFHATPLCESHGIVSSVTVVIQGTDGPFGVLGARSTQRRRFSADDVNFLQGVANVLALAIERKRVEQALERSNERLRILRELDQGLVLAKSPSAIAEVALTHIRRLVPCRSASLSLFQAESGETIPLAADTDAEQALDAAPPSITHLEAMETLRSGTIHAVHDVRSETATSLELPAGIRSFVDVPLVAQEDLIGVIRLASDRPGAFGPVHLEMIREVTRPLAVAIEQARLNERIWIGRERLRLLSRRLVEVQESERRHLSRELHDEIGQVLTGLKLRLETARSASNPTFPEDIAEARRLVGELMERVRALSLDLRPAMLDDLGLLATLVWHLERYRTETKIAVDFKQRGLEDRRFGAEIETAAYRIVQEALTNVARHAGARAVTVRAWDGDGTLTVQVDDDGAGFDRALIGAGRGGLSGMRERALLLGGRFEVESAPGRGTRITAELPLNESADRRTRAR